MATTKTDENRTEKGLIWALIGAVFGVLMLAALRAYDKKLRGDIVKLVEALYVQVAAGRE